MPKKKVLYVITKSNWGGAQRYVFDLASGLPKDRFEAVVALGGSGGKDAEPGLLYERLSSAGVRSIFVRSFMRDISLLREVDALRELIAIFKQEAPDAVHLNSSKAGGLGALAARMAGVQNIVFTSHGLPWDENRNPLARFAIYLLSKFTFALCHKVIVITEDNLKRIGTPKAVLVHNGIAPQEMLGREAARAALAQTMRPFPTRTLWIGSGTELTRNKGLRTLIGAAGILKEKKKEFAVCIIGTGEEKEALASQIKKEGLEEAYLLGFVPDAAKYFAAFDLFVLPSVKEGFPYSLLEVGQAGCAVIATRVGGIPDLIEDNATGLLVAHRDTHALAEAIERLLDNAPLREHIGTALKERTAQFSLQKMVAETETLY